MDFIYRRIFRISTFASIALMSSLGGVANAQNNPFKPMPKKAQVERVREYDLKNVLLNLRVIWEWRTLSGTVTETLAPLTDNPKALSFDCGKGITVTACKVDSADAKFEVKDGKLNVTPPAALKKDADTNVAITYFCKPTAPGSDIGGFLPGVHWVEPDAFAPERKPSVWTQGETEDNHEWVPIYDYPNDKTTSETYIEVPETWRMVGNGALVDTAENAALHTKTFHYKMTQPFSTYLLSLAGGEMDVVTDQWEDRPLIYAVPKGMGNLIPTSFGDTKDMLTFYSERFGVKYAWPKYAQTCVFDFGGGMENVSATTLVAGALADERNEPWAMAGLNSHELGHQWFGDLITCRNWGNIWLNEGFATFMQMIYFEHSRGKDAYEMERYYAWQGYLNESRRYKRPIVTQFFTAPGVMFDSHTYPKGGLVIHALRRVMGDDAFFKGMGHYLEKCGYTPVDTQDLIKALEESSGQKLQGFFDQWVYKPGHPVLKYDWQYDRAAKQVKLHISQKQDRSDGTPIYAIDLPASLLIGEHWTQATLALNKAEQDFTLPCADSPISLLIDPNHDYPLEQKGQVRPGEAEADLTLAPCGIDRLYAAQELSKTERGALLVLQAAQNEPGRIAASEMIQAAQKYRRISARAAYRALIHHKDDSRRAAALRGLGQLPANSEDVAAIRVLINDKESYEVVNAALYALSLMDADGNIETFKAALAMPSNRDTIASAALDALAHCHNEAGFQALLAETATGNPRRLRLQALENLSSQARYRSRTTPSFYALLNDEDWQIQRQAIEILAGRRELAASDALRKLAAETKHAEIRNTIRDTLNAWKNQADAAPNAPRLPMPSALLPQ